MGIKRINFFYFIVMLMYICALAIITGINHFLYKNIISLSFFYAFGFFMIVVTIFRLLKNINLNKSIVLTNIIILLLFSLSFVYFSPKYSYKTAFETIINENKYNVDFNESNVSTTKLVKDYNFFVKKGYLFRFVANNNKMIIVFNPINGEIYTSSE